MAPVRGASTSARRNHWKVVRDSLMHTPPPPPLASAGTTPPSSPLHCTSYTPSPTSPCSGSSSQSSSSAYVYNTSSSSIHEDDFDEHQSEFEQIHSLRHGLHSHIILISPPSSIASDSCSSSGDGAVVDKGFVGGCCRGLRRPSWLQNATKLQVIRSPHGYGVPHSQSLHGPNTHSAMAKPQWGQGSGEQESPIPVLRHAETAPLGMGPVLEHPIMSPLNVTETNNVVTGEDEEGNKTINEYSVVRTLGRGAFSKVKLMIHNPTDKLFAIKVIDKNRWKRLALHGKAGIDDVRSEIAIMKKIRHPNVVSLYEVLDDVVQEKIYLVLDYVERGPVVKLRPGFTLEAKDRLTPDLARKYMRDVICGLLYLHRQNIVHRDIKPDNLLLSSDGRVRIADFGVSCTSSCLNLCGAAGTPAFMAPELQDCSRPAGDGRPADIWALGVTLYIMLYGKLPFPLVGAYGVTLEPVMLELPEDCEVTLRALFNAIFQINPARRITLQELARHPWITGAGNLPKIYSPRTPRIHATQQEIDRAIVRGRNITLARLQMLMNLKKQMKLRAENARTACRRNSLRELPLSPFT